MSFVTILALRALIILLGLGALLGQIRVLPVFGFGIAADAELPALGVPYTVVGIAIAACFQVALVAVWVLLSMVRRDAIFSEHAFRWVDVITAVGAVATILLLGLAAHLYYVVNPILDAPGLIAITGGAALFGAAFVLLMVVMRGLLRAATTLQSELAEVV